MLRVIAPAIRHPTNRNLVDFHAYWQQQHGPLYARTTILRRYVQHLTLHEAYDDDPAPSYDGVSMFWFDDLETLLHRGDDPDAAVHYAAVLADDRQLFDRSTDWPLAHRRASVVGTEHVIVDGPTEPSMVKGIFLLARRPGLSLQDLSDHWRDVDGPNVARLPGLRRLVQVHALPEAFRLTGLLSPTHDGCGELWFDDYPSLRRAMASEQWQELAEAAKDLFAEPISWIAAREFVQKG